MDKLGQIWKYIFYRVKWKMKKIDSVKNGKFC